MGMLVDGQWHDEWYDTKTSGGRFIRSEAQFRNWVTADGSAGPSGEGGFAAAAGRYHLYIGHACPWAHRALIFRQLKGLEEQISISVVHWYMAEQGWTFADGEGVIGDPISAAQTMHSVYTAADAAYSGRVTIPVLWDKQRATIVSNESSEIIRMFNGAFDCIGALPGDYYPKALRAEIDVVNARVYATVNNGVYRSGFASTQAAYNEAVVALFETLDWLERKLAEQTYLCGERLTEADWRLFTTLVRFDPVYHYHFKCNLRRIRDYPNLHRLLLRLYGMPGIAETVHMDHIKNHYFGSHRTINPTGIVPMGPSDLIGST
jgi:putative glutathione S-transferase